MPGTKAGGIKAAKTNKKIYGDLFYKTIGKMGGKVSRGGGFAHHHVSTDGMTGPQRAAVAGHRGGVNSRKPKR